MLKLQNLLEEEVIITVNRLTDNSKDKCHCDKCKLDMAAIALNNLPPMYVVTNEGMLYGKVKNMTQQFNADVILQVTKAMDIVWKNPHH